MSLRSLVVSAVAGLSIVGAHVGASMPQQLAPERSRVQRRRRPARRPAQTEGQRVSASAAQVSADAEVEQGVLSEVNRLRSQAGLHPLHWDARLAEVARQHSADMARRRYFAHASPAGVTFADRLNEAKIPYHAAGENLFQAWGRVDPVAAAVRGWARSPRHRANMLRPEFEKTGIGAVRIGRRWYVTQDLIRP